MASYKLILSKQVRKKDLPKIPAKTRQRIIDLTGPLQVNARPAGATKLTNREEYKLRCGSYRILYEVNDEKRQIEIRKVRHRGEAYRK